jgi:hypothetical protein
MKTKKYGEAATVGEIMEVLSKLPKDLPCYFRPKYHGTVEYTDEIPINLNGIGEMEPNNKPKNVTFLC